jgi:Domain of unknown function (DUF4190)/Septum formation
VGLRYNPPPGWPPAPPGFTPPPGWQPDPSWPTPPPGWQLWVNDDQLPAGSLPTQAAWTAQTPDSPGNRGPGAGAGVYGGGGYGNPGSPYGPGTPNYAGGANYADTANYAGAMNGGADGYDGAPGQYGEPGPFPRTPRPDHRADAANPGSGGAYPTAPAPYPGTGGAYPGGPSRYPGAGGGPYPGADPYNQGMPPGSGKMSGWAIAGFVTGLIGAFLLGVIFGFIALGRIKRLGQRGRGLAIAGIVLSAVWLIGFIAIGVVGAHGQPSQSANPGQITHSRKLSVFSLAVGDCFNNPAGASSVTTVTAIPCNKPHNAQIYAKFNLTGSDLSYPGTSKVTKLAAAGCNARTSTINKSAAPSTTTIRLLFPEQDAWVNGRRTVACMIVNPSADITSSLVN